MMATPQKPELREARKQRLAEKRNIYMQLNALQKKLSRPKQKKWEESCGNERKLVTLHAIFRNGQVEEAPGAA